jgi:ABC-type glycerol-3-phosphate transport system permease component
VKLLPQRFTLENYTLVFTFIPYTKYFKNSVIVTSVTVVCSIIVSTLAGYSFSRFQFPGKSLSAFLILATQMFPLVTGIIPLYLIFSKIRLIDNYGSLWLAYIAFTIPFCTWMLKGFFDSIPKELEDSAKIDGCTPIGTLLRIILPLSLPALAATAVFCFILAWNEFLYATVFTTSEKARTLPAALGLMMGQGYTQWGGLNAAGVLTTIPVVIFFVVLQRYLIQGLTAGALKG